MPKNIGTERQLDFTGGLNLRADAFQLDEHESPDLLNVDVSQRGGFQLRGGIDAYKGVHTGDFESLHYFDTTTGTAQLVASDGTNAIYWTGSAWATIYAMTGQVRTVTFKDIMYLVDGTKVVSWDGSTATLMKDPAVATTSWNNDIAAPDQGDVPTAECVAVHMGCMFVANCTENGTQHANRVRWSHPNQPEDWMDYHYIDIDTGVDGDEIVGLVPFGDRLLVFKRRSVHAIYGTPPEAFQVFPVSQEVGAISQEAIASSDLGVYFFSWPEGVYLYSGKGVQWVFERLKPAITEDYIPDEYADQIQLGWGKDRLWVAAPYSDIGLAPTTRTHCFILDPTLGKEGSWVLYDLSVGPFLEWNEPGSATELVANQVGLSQLCIVDQKDLPFDDPTGGDTDHIDSYLMTHWVDLGNAGYRKRWKRPDIIMRRGTNATVNVESYRNYDPGHATRFFPIQSTEDVAAAKYGTAVFGTDVYSTNRDDRNEIERGSPLGNAEAVALKFHGPPTNSDWGIDGIIYKYIPRKVRG